MNRDIATISYKSIQRRLRNVSDHMAQCWTGIDRFEIVHETDISQVSKLTVGPNLKRLTAKLSPIRDAAFRKLCRRIYGSNDEFTHRSRYLFRIFGRLPNEKPGRILVEQNKKCRLIPRWLHETSLVVSVAGMRHPLLSQIWEHYPRHGIPIGLRQDGVIVMFIGKL